MTVQVDKVIAEFQQLLAPGWSRHSWCSDREDPIVSLFEQFADEVSKPLLQTLFAVRNANREIFNAVEGANKFTVKAWKKDEHLNVAHGGGVMSILRGEVLEKAAVNMSVVRGEKYPALEGEHAGKPFLAAGVSLICHPRNPHGPIAHMNVRSLRVGEGKDAVNWIGGGGDLTPMVKYDEDTEMFHAALREATLRHRPSEYDRYRKWCDEYFFIPHRGETRGVGGIFFDYLKIDSDAEFDFLRDVGLAFARAYGKILERRTKMPYDEALKEKQLWWRGRYAEFNLVYDRGTRFGLLSGGNTEAIFASLPPIVKW